MGVLCIQARVDQAFFHEAGGRAGNDVTFSNYVTFSFIYYKTCDEHVST